MAAAWLTPCFVKAPDIQENRVLAAQPAWPQHLSEVEAFRQAADPYVADHFPIRPYLIGLLNRLRMLVGVSGSNRVIVGRQGWLFFDDGTHLGASRGDPPILGPEARSWLSFLAGRTETLKARNIPYVVVAAPVKETIYPQFGPAWYPGPSSQRSTLLLSKLARDAGVGDVLYLHPYVAQATRNGQKTFSRHDTHWTGYGAYAGYAGLMGHLQALGLTEGPRPMSDFIVETSHAKNRPRDLALMLGVASFVDIDFPHIDNPGGRSENPDHLPGPQAGLDRAAGDRHWRDRQACAADDPGLVLQRDPADDAAALQPDHPGAQSGRRLAPRPDRPLQARHRDPRGRGAWPAGIDGRWPDGVQGGHDPYRSRDRRLAHPGRRGDADAGAAERQGRRDHGRGEDHRRLQSRNRRLQAERGRRGDLHGVRLDLGGFRLAAIGQGLPGAQGRQRGAGRSDPGGQAQARRGELFQQSEDGLQRLRRDLCDPQDAARTLRRHALPPGLRWLDGLCG